MEINLNVSQAFASYITDWDYKQYLLVGGYGSGKSYNTALKIVLKLLQEKRTALVVRNVMATIKESCFSLFKEILQNLNLLSDTNDNRTSARDGKIVAVQSPMEIRFPNGSRIIFRGMDNVEKIKSIHGVSIVWIEECSELKYEAYKELLGRVRQPDVTLHFILSCNPVGKENWVYDRFFTHIDERGEAKTICDEERFYKKKILVVNGVYYMHSLPTDNPFLPKSYIQTLDELKVYDPHLYTVARLGRFGANGLRVLPQFEIARNARQFVSIVNSISSRFHFFGLDFGFETSYNALISCCVDDKEKILYIYDEVYRNHITDDKFAKLEHVQRVRERVINCDKTIFADGAEPKAIQYYRQCDFPMYKCKKYAGSKLQNIKKIKRFKKIVCSPKCVNTIRELKDLTYAKDRQGNDIWDEFNVDAHTFDALAYALNNYTVADVKDVKTYSKAG